MSVAKVSPIVVNKNVVDLFRFFKEKENQNEGYTASHETVETLLPNRSELYRKQY
jgi:hypothetical protein